MAARTVGIASLATFLRSTHPLPSGESGTVLGGRAWDEEAHVETVRVLAKQTNTSLWECLRLRFFFQASRRRLSWPPQLCEGSNKGATEAFLGPTATFCRGLRLGARFVSNLSNGRRRSSVIDSALACLSAIDLNVSGISTARGSARMHARKGVLHGPHYKRLFDRMRWTRLDARGGKCQAAERCQVYPLRSAAPWSLARWRDDHQQLSLAVHSRVL
jgi:hypothetical protein